MNTQMARVPITRSESGEETVSARELHSYLDVGRDFSNWIKDRIKKYDFQEGVDFTTHEDLSSPNLASSKARPQKIIEYTLTLDMAKELCLVENNEKGKAARKYYLEIERRYKKVGELINEEFGGPHNALYLAFDAQLRTKLAGNRKMTYNRFLYFCRYLDVRPKLENWEIEKLMGLRWSTLRRYVKPARDYMNKAYNAGKETNHNEFEEGLRSHGVAFPQLTEEENEAYTAEREEALKKIDRKYGYNIMEQAAEIQARMAGEKEDDHDE